MVHDKSTELNLLKYNNTDFSLVILTDDVRDQLPLEQDLVPEGGLVEVESVVEVRDRSVVKLVEHAHVVDQRLQRFQDRRKLQEPMDLKKLNGTLNNHLPKLGKEYKSRTGPRLD